MKMVIDRFESEFAVCEKAGGLIVNIEKKLLPPGAAPGDVLIVDGIRVTVDRLETEKRRRRIAEKAEKMWE